MSETPRALLPSIDGNPLLDEEEYGVTGKNILALNQYAEDLQRDHYRRLNSLKNALHGLANDSTNLPSFLSQISLLLADMEYGTQSVLNFHSLCYGIYKNAADKVREALEPKLEPQAEEGAE